jgi:hypothetical protein
VVTWNSIALKEFKENLQPYAVSDSLMTINIKAYQLDCIFHHFIPEGAISMPYSSTFLKKN